MIELLIAMFVYLTMSVSAVALVLSVFHTYIAYLSVNRGPFKTMFKRTLLAILLVGVGWAILSSVAVVEGWLETDVFEHIDAIASLMLCIMMLYISMPHSKIKELFA